MTTNFLLDRLVKKGLMLMKKVQYDQMRSDSVPIEVYKNRCLGYIERINELKYINNDDLENARKRLFNVYFYLQSVSGPERQVPHQTEVSIETVSKALDQAVADDYARRKGGLGYSGTTGLTLSEDVGEPINHYFRKVEKKPVTIIRPVNSEHKVNAKQTMEEWKDEMAMQKKEILDGVMSRLQRKDSNSFSSDDNM